MNGTGHYCMTCGKHWGGKCSCPPASVSTEFTGCALRFDCDPEETQIVMVDGTFFCGTVRLQFEGRKSACIWRLQVHPKARRQGIGTRLVECCCKIAKDAGCETIGLTLDKDNEGAAGFYRKLGFIFGYEFDDSFVMVRIL